MKDNLENFFLNRLKDNLPAEAEWNMPSDDAWNVVNEALQEKKSKKRPLFFIWFLVGMVGLGLLYSLFAIQNLKHQIAVLEKTTFIEKIALPNNADSNTDIISNEVIIIEDKKQEIQVLNNDGEEISDDLILVNKTKALNNKVKPSIESIKQQPLNTGNFVSAETRAQTNNTLIAGSFSTNRYNKILTDLGKKPAQVNIETHASVSRSNTNIQPILSALMELRSNVGPIELLCPSPKSTITSDDVISSNKYVELFLAPVWTSVPTSGRPPSEFETFRGSDIFKLTYAGGINFGREILPNFYIKSGINYQGIKYWSASDVSINYDSSLEFLNLDGEMENLQKVVIPTAIGTMVSDINMVHPVDLLIEDNDPLEINFDMHQQLGYLSIPIGVEYNIPLADKLALNISAGISWNHLISTSNIIIPLVKHNGSKLNAKSVNVGSLNAPNIFNYAISTGVDYSLNAKFDMTLRGTYFKNITPLFNMGEMTTKAQGISLSFGIKNKF